MRKKRTIIIGLDGAPFRLIEDFSKNGVMPNIGKIIESGTFKQMTSSIPEVSSVAWSSIITGTNPGEHGVFGFTDLAKNTYRLSFTNFNSLKRKAFWEENNQKRHIVINVPSTYPARELNGILVSGFVAPNAKKAVYPDSFLSFLNEIDYRFDVDSSKAHESMKLFMKDLNKTNEARISLYRHLWHQDWDTFMLVFTGSDRLMHFLWDAYGNPAHEFYRDFLGYFNRVDEIIGEIANELKEEDNLIIISDHGFESLEYDVYLNAILKISGLFKLQDEKRLSLSNIDTETRLFALDPSRIYVHTKERYPRARVNNEDKKYILKDIESLFKSLEFSGRKVIKDVFRKEEIYKGPYMDDAPDIVLVGEKGFNLKASLGSKEIFSRSVFAGKHTQHDAFILLNRPFQNEIPDNVNVSDVINVLNRLKKDPSALSGPQDETFLREKRPEVSIN
ncbi:alkaline phosphatase family protein [Candidatus Omnitrophota bacterium]